jgi:hypothetical protein
MDDLTAVRRIAKDRLNVVNIVRSAELLSSGRYLRKVVVGILVASFGMLFLHSWTALGFVLPDPALKAFSVSIPMALIAAIADYVRELGQSRRSSGPGKRV